MIMWCLVITYLVWCSATLMANDKQSITLPPHSVTWERKAVEAINKQVRNFAREKMIIIWRSVVFVKNTIIMCPCTLARYRSLWCASVSFNTASLIASNSSVSHLALAYLLKANQKCHVCTWNVGHSPSCCTMNMDQVCHYQAQP